MKNTACWARIALAATSAVCLNGCADTADTPFATASNALASADVLGFESIDAWSTSSGALALNSEHLQGNSSLSISNVASFARLRSANLSTLDADVSSAFGVRLKLPTNQPNPYWLGTLGLLVDAPSIGLYNVYLGTKELTGLPLGTFEQLLFEIPTWVQATLREASYADLSFQLELSVPVGSQQYLFDELRFARTVHVVYLVPSDKHVQPTYVANLENAIKHLQAFYHNEIGNGRSFSLASPVVTVVNTPNPSSYYAQGSGQFEFHSRILEDGLAATGGAFFRDKDIWLLYIDADPPCGSATGGNEGVATFPANDLRGLAGVPIVPICPGDPPQPNRCRWVGGMGHELGHAWNLPHPPGCEQGLAECPSEALMWTGFSSYPNTFLLPEDLALLANDAKNASFFNPIALPTTLPDCTAP